MIKIEQIKVSNFRNIGNATLQLNNFNVLVGVNNSGKSNFLQVLNFLNFIINESAEKVKNSFNGNDWGTLHSSVPHSLRDLDKGKMDFFIKFCNLSDKKLFSYSLKINWEKRKEDDYPYWHFRIEEEKLDYKERNRTGPSIIIFRRKLETVNYGVNLTKTKILEEIPNFASVIRFLDIISEENNPYKEAIDTLNKILKTPIFYFSNIQLIRDIKSEYEYDSKHRIIAYNLENEIFKLPSDKLSILEYTLKDILNIEDIIIHKIKTDKGGKKHTVKYLFFSHFNTIKTFRDFSDGTILLIALITKILNSEDYLFFIEEPENSLHPKVLIKTINFIKSYSKEKQFLIATHSLQVINIVTPNEVIIFDLKENGQSEVSNVSSIKDIKRKLRQGYVDFSDVLFFGEGLNDEFGSID